MDAVLEQAVDLARAAAVEVADGDGSVGDHLSASTESDRLVTHVFACTLPGYRGWVWSVTLSRAPRGKEAAVCEAHLVAADEALLAPAWVPWAERVQPGDIKPGMAVPRFDPDPRLQPGYTVTDVEDEDAVAIWELGLGRERVLGPLGRDEAAERWTKRIQDSGSASRDASSPTEAIGEFVIPLAGSMRLHFGVCANKWCPFDGTVVPVDHACEGQNPSAPERSTALWPVNNPVFDTDASVALDLSAPEARGDAEAPADAQADAVASEDDGAASSEAAAPGETQETSPAAETEAPASKADAASTPAEESAPAGDPAAPESEGAASAEAETPAAEAGSEGEANAAPATADVDTTPEVTEASEPATASADRAPEATDESEPEPTNTNEPEPAEAPEPAAAAPEAEPEATDASEPAAASASTSGDDSGDAAADEDR
ncbi:DUF3027 domain-containing protein [Demequina sp. NBRC 110056]|uniref:DUF3027 domain-containing protein n=1 Tax=Demequina sp. NBRC 110056 TaxID=1570345 RepID=UPI00117E6A7F|nr:DUF3027 domain-containing protein [Demequina sp. NBRC 110056]